MIPMHMGGLFGNSATLTTAQVAKREGLTTRQVQWLCAKGRLDPCRKFGRVWMIGEGYCYTKPDRITKIPLIVAARRPRGRPKGSLNSRPYPKGVKRPRIKR